MSAAMRLTKDQITQATAVLGRAFQEYPLFQRILPNAASRPAGITALHGSVIRYCLKHGEVYTTPDLAGVACWLPPERPFPTFFRMVQAGMLRVPFHMGWSSCRQLNAVDALAQKLHHTHAPGPHWYLWVIGVDPDYQGKGMAGQLMRPVTERADKDQLPCYLETHKELNVTIYQRLGFQIAEHVDLFEGTGSMWGMLRRPRP
jgi:ribosomal protein S18 acetylase RimI-like enzyme